MHRYRDTRSPAVEVLMHLPPGFRNVDSFRSFLGIKPERIRRYATPKDGPKGIVDVRSYQFSQVVPDRKRRHEGRTKRQAMPESETVESRPLKIENDPSLEPGKFLPPPLVDGAYPEKLSDHYPETIIEMPAPVRGPVYTSYPASDMESEMMDPDDPRKRRNTSANDHDESNQRDKRTFMEAGDNRDNRDNRENRDNRDNRDSRDSRESTTTPPFWKRKKDSPPFITGRESRVQKGNNYTPPQHRSADNGKQPGGSVLLLVKNRKDN